MTSGTVGYTDTRGNKDYTSIIASQIGKRLKQASNMASDERAFAEQQAEAGGTSLSEAGIGKGYFFGRALGNRFGGDRISRTKGRMGVGGDANNPASNYKQRFRGSFDYNVNNQVSNITDTVPLSNAVITGLRGVQTGLTQVASAISRQDSTMDGLANTQADMAKAIMFNGYLFQMFMSQQKTKSGRSSANREERRIEGRGFGGGRGGGFGGGGGRGMINVTPRGGSGGGRSGGSGGGGGASFFTGNILSSASRVGSTSLSAGRGLNSIAAGAKSAKGYKALASGDIVGLMQKDGMSLYDKLGINTAEVTGDVAAKNPDSIALAAAKMLGLNADKTDSLVDFVSSGAKKGSSSVKFMDDALAASRKFPDLYKSTNTAGRRILQIKTLAEQFGTKPDAISNEMMKAVANLSDYDATVSGARKAMSKGIPTNQFDIYMNTYDDLFGAVAKKYGQKNARQFMKLGLFNAGDALIDGVDTVKDTSIIADKLMKHYPDMTYESLEKAVLMARVGDLAEGGMGSSKIVKAVRKQLGNNVADELFLKYSEDIFTNPKVAAAFGKGSGRTMLRSFLKRLPLIGLGAGLIFGLQRAMEGDLVGASLEIGSGVLGLTPATTGLGLMIDGYLFGRDMGLMPMAKGGTGSLSSLLGPSILNQATVAGFAGNNAVVGGEAGKEAFIPLEGTQGEIAGSVFGEANAISFLKFLKKKPIDDLRYDSEDGIDQKNPFTPGSILHKNFERMRQYDMQGLEISKNNMSGVTDNNADAFKLSSQRAVNQETIVTAPTVNNYYNNGGGGGDRTTRDEVQGAPFASLDLQEYYAKMGASRRS